jgi:hypothetical protein
MPLHVPCLLTCTAAKQIGVPGELPPNSSDEDESSSSEDDSDIRPQSKSAAPAQQRRRPKDDEPDPEQVAKDMERLKLMKEKREKQRLERIEKEGWDRFSPLSATNKPPDGKSVDHPEFEK